jgi:hypothetical protein
MLVSVQSQRAVRRFVHVGVAGFGKAIFNRILIKAASSTIIILYP